MPELNPIKCNKFISWLKEFGFKGPYSGGKHSYMIKDELRLTMPNPHRKEIGINLLSRLLKQAGITREEWVEKK